MSKKLTNVKRLVKALRKTRKLVAAGKTTQEVQYILLRDQNYHVDGRTVAGERATMGRELLLRRAA